MGVNHNTRIGERTKVMDLAVITGNSVIGDDVFISMAVGMANDDEIGRAGYDPDRVKGPTIEDGVAIGVGAILLPGVVVGRGAIVGAGSVETRNVAAQTLVMGTPERPVRSLD